jgi:hypothetical protein
MLGGGRADLASPKILACADRSGAKARYSDLTHASSAFS